MTRFLLIGLLVTGVQMGFAAEKATKPAAPAPAAQGTISGKVLETMNSGGYTYVQVDTGKSKVWAAAPQFAVKKGDTVSIADGMPMQNYQSKTLNRTFDTVYFTGAVTVNGQKPSGSASLPNMGNMPKDHPPIGGAAANKLPQGHPEIDSQMPKDHPPLPSVPAPKIQGLTKAKDGHTVAEVYSSQAKLNGKNTQIRGKVVRFNSMIMGKNWIHIQDGTGAAGSNDLLVTSQQPAKVGDTVLVSGTIVTNKDFGAGYKYGVMMENATVKVE